MLYKLIEAMHNTGFIKIPYLPDISYILSMTNSITVNNTNFMFFPRRSGYNCKELKEKEAFCYLYVIHVHVRYILIKNVSQL